MVKNKSCRNPCKECPWIKSGKHNESWPKYVSQMKNIGKIKKNEHGCHMITSDIWGYGTSIDENNICIGSKLT